MGGAGKEADPGFFTAQTSPMLTVEHGSPCGGTADLGEATPQLGDPVLKAAMGLGAQCHPPPCLQPGRPEGAGWLRVSRTTREDLRELWCKEGVTWLTSVGC